MDNRLADGTIDAINNIRSGDRQAREDFIVANRGFILGNASRVANRRLREGVDDEYSVALQAFNEAIDSYDPSRGASFQTFSGTVIRRRLIDYFRHTARNKEIPISQIGSEDEENSIIDTASVDSSWEDNEELGRKEEIEYFDRTIGEYGFSLQDLARTCPKHQDTREASRAVAKILSSDNELMGSLIANKTVPISILAKMANVSHKVIERQRIYIIALALLFSGDFPMLQEYIS